MSLILACWKSISQQTFISCSKSTIETLEKGVKYFQRQQYKNQNDVFENLNKNINSFILPCNSVVVMSISHDLVNIQTALGHVLAFQPSVLELFPERRLQKIAVAENEKWTFLS